MPDKQKQKRGFTLVELLVVIAIIGNLSVIAIINLNDARALARDAVRMQDLNTFSKGLELYYSTYGVYPCGNGGYSDPTNGNDLATVDTTFSCDYNLDEINKPGFLNGPGDEFGSSGNCLSAGPSDRFGLFKEDVLYSNCPKDPRNVSGPLDPTSDTTSFGYGYVYTASNDRLSYTLTTYLERNSSRMQNDGGVCSKYYELHGGVGKNNTYTLYSDIRLGKGCNW